MLLPVMWDIMKAWNEKMIFFETNGDGLGVRPRVCQLKSVNDKRPKTSSSGRDFLL